MMSMEISSAKLEDRVAQDDYMQYKYVRDIITKCDFPTSNMSVSTGVARIPTFTIYPIFRNLFCKYKSALEWSIFSCWCIMGRLR